MKINVTFTGECDSFFRYQESRIVKFPAIVLDYKKEVTLPLGYFFSVGRKNNIKIFMFLQGWFCTCETHSPKCTLAHLNPP